MKDRVAKSLFWIVWSRAAVQPVSFLTTLLVARLLEPRDYGLMALAGVWIFGVALVAELGLGAAIVQFRDLEERELNACFWLVTGMTVAGYLALYASAPTIGDWFNSRRLADILRVVGLSLLLVAVRTVPEALLRKRLQLDRISQAVIASAVVTMPVVLGLAWSGAGVWALVAGALVGPLVQSLLSFWFAGWWPGLRIGSRRLPEILRYSLAAQGATLGWAAYLHADTIVLGKIAGDALLGFYWMGKLIATLPVDKVSVVANQLASPIMAGLQADRPTMRASFLRGLRLVATVTVPVCVGMALVADDFILLALSEKWARTVPLLQVLCVFGLIRSLDVLVPPVLFARYRATFMFWWTTTLLVVMSGAFWAGAVWLGAAGVALALAVGYPLMSIWKVREALHELELGWTAVWRQLRPIVGATLVVAVCVLAIRWALPVADPLDRVTRLALAVGSGALVYTVAILRWGGPLAGEIANVAGWLLPWRHLRPVVK